MSCSFLWRIWNNLLSISCKTMLRTGMIPNSYFICHTQVYPATLLEMNRALMKGEGSEAASSRRRRQGREERGRMRMRSSGRSQTSRSRTSRSRTEVKRSGSSARSPSRRWHRTRNTSMEEKGTTDSSMSLNQYSENKVRWTINQIAHTSHVERMIWFFIN